MADTEERARKREERRQKRREKDELKNKTNGTNDKVIHDTPEINLNRDPDISRETEEGLEQKSDAALPDVVKVPSGLNENWDRPLSPDKDEEDLRGKNGYKSYSNAINAGGDKAGLQKKRDDYNNTVLTGQRRYDSDEDAAFEPEVQSPPPSDVPPGERAMGGTEPGGLNADDEWSNVPRQSSEEKPKSVKDRVKTHQARDEPQHQKSHRRSVSWESGIPRANVAESRGVNKPAIKPKEDRAWIREIPQVPEPPIPREPDWLDLVRKRRWRSTVKARFPQTERERIQFERRLDTAKKGLKFNPRGEPIGIVGPQMDDELSMYLIQQRRRIESDSVFETSGAASSRSGPSDRSVSDSDYSYSGEFSFENDPKNRELAAAKGILNLSRPPLMGPRKEVHKNLAMETSRQSTMQWRFSIDPHEEPIWAQLPQPDDIVAINEMEGNLGAKFWANKVKFQTGQFDPPPVKPKPRGRSHSTGEVEVTGSRHDSSSSELRSEEVIPSASISPVKEMRRKLAAGDFKTSTPLPRKPFDVEQGYISKLRDIQQRLADEAEQVSAIGKPSYISKEELDAIGEHKRNISEETFTEKIEKPKPLEKPVVKRTRSDADLLNLLASRKEEADANAIGMEGEIASTASVISKAFEKLNASEEIEQEKRRQKERKEREKERMEKEQQEETKRKQLEEERMKKEGEEEMKRKQEEKEGEKTLEKEEEIKKKEMEQKRRQDEREQKGKSAKRSTLPPEFLVKLKDCEVLEGNDLSLEVVLSGDPEPTVEWFVDDRKVNSDNRHKMSSHGTVHSLTITNLELDDEGIYECVATNSAGQTTCDCEVLVND